MPRLRALTSWSGRKAGEEFDASETDARILCAADGLGGQKAQIVDRQMKPAEPQPAEASTPKQQSSSDETPERKRRYLRRDLRAQP